MTKTIHLIHSKKHHPIHVEAIKMMVLAIAVALIIAIWSCSGDASAQLMSSVPPYEGPLEWLASVWHIFVKFLEIAFWVTIALAGTMIVLLALAALGMITWLIQRVGQGIAYVWSITVSQWSWINISAGDGDKIIASDDIIASDEEGEPVTIHDWLMEAGESISSLEERVDALEEKLEKI